MVKKALLIAYHYPPVQVSSGLQRTLTFSRHLQSHGWTPLLLSAHPRAYANTSPEQLQDIPEDVLVKRAFALDTSRHLAFRGIYPGFLALPDRWISWWVGGVLTGFRLIRKHKPQVIFSTYPIATAHLIALTLHQLTGIPWVADFRDPMTEGDYPQERRKRRIYQWIESQAVHKARCSLVTTPGALRLYRERYPQLSPERWILMPNGYSEAIFSEVEAQLPPLKKEGPPGDGLITLLHSGVLYPWERDPKHFFAAVAALRRQGQVSPTNLRIVLRAAGHEQYFRDLLNRYGIEDLIELLPGLSYREALAEMFAADGLLVFQADNCNHQVPAKIYEYFRAKRPIFALTDTKGDTARTLVGAGIEAIVPLDDEHAIAEKLLTFLQAVRRGEADVAADTAVREYSREQGVKRLADIFDSLLGASQGKLVQRQRS